MQCGDLKTLELFIHKAETLFGASAPGAAGALMRQAERENMKVKTYCINKGQISQYFGLMNAKSNDILRYAPNHWKTEKGALKWAINHGYEI